MYSQKQIQIGKYIYIRLFQLAQPDKYFGNFSSLTVSNRIKKMFICSRNGNNLSNSDDV